MEQIAEKYKTLILRFLIGEITTGEKQKLDAWVAASDNNRSLFAEYKQVWKLQPPEKLVKVNKDAAFEKIAGRIDNAGNHGRNFQFSKRQRRNYFFAIGIAASLLLLIGTYFTFFKAPEPILLKVAAAGPGFEKVLLPDQSTVYLKPGAEITYPEKFTSGAREVQLSGEAFFEVNHNPGKPFIVVSPQTKIRVLGTSFNVAPIKDGKFTQVSVVSGKVRFSDLQDLENVVLTKNMNGTYDHQTGLFSSATFDNMNFLAWKTGILEFHETPLVDVFRVLGNTYGKKIKIETDIRDKKLTARFDNDTPENIFRSLSLLYGFNIESSNNSFIIK